MGGVYEMDMSRKTRATYRETMTPAGILQNIKYAYGEIYVLTNTTMTPFGETGQVLRLELAP